MNASRTNTSRRTVSRPSTAGRTRIARRVAVVGGVAASAVVLLAGPALAHVGVQPVGEAAKGGYATVNFKVPNERDDASTVKLEVNFPTEHPLASVSPQAVPGWKIAVTKSKLAKPIELHGKQITEAVSKVTWTATGDGVEAGYFQQFPLSIGQLPEDADQLVFKSLQTYSNDEVVRWIDAPTEGAEPESPAPVLALTAASEDGHGAASDDKAGDDDAKGGTDNASAEGEGDDTENAASSDSSDGTARTLGVVGIVIGLAGVAYGVLAGRRRTPSTGSSTGSTGTPAS